MITLASEPIVKKYSSSIFSRSFCLSNICYFMVILLPLLVMININYAWPEYSRIVLIPQLQYRAYQLTCSNSLDVVIYNSNFNGQIGKKNQFSFVSGTVENDIIFLQGEIFSGQLLSCNIQVYMQSLLQTSIASIVNIPLSFHSQSQSSFLSRATVKGRAQIVSKSPIPQSSILTINQSEYSPPSSFTFIDNWEFSGVRNITLNMKQQYISVETNPNPANNKFSFDVQLRIGHHQYIKQNSLVEKLRSIVPICVFLSVLLYYVIIDPLVDWMIENKIYSGKTMHAKVKAQ